MRVLAALDNSAGAAAVAEFAAALGRVLAAEVELLHVREDGTGAAQVAAERSGLSLSVERGDPGASLRRRAKDDDVAALVLGRSSKPHDGPVGEVARALLLEEPKPVAVVPAEAAHPGRLARILVPLEGTRSTSRAPRRTIELARDAGLEIVLVHVFAGESVPAFTDQPQHETAAWAGEFLARYCPCPPEDVRLECRVGDPAGQVVAVAREIDADVIAMGWSQELAAGRARVIRAALEEVAIPLFLIPVMDAAELAPTMPESPRPLSARRAP